MVDVSEKVAERQCIRRRVDDAQMVDGVPGRFCDMFLLRKAQPANG